jgi:secreted Zn-dependent insulinase-like peptidase
MAVHDKESKVTAVTASVNVGAAADPKELNGLAHFAEHMCFLLTGI